MNLHIAGVRAIRRGVFPRARVVRAPQQLHRKIASLGVLRGMTLITGVSVTLSMGAIAMIVPAESPILLPALGFAFLIPAIIASLMSGLVFGLIEELDQALRDLDRLASTDDLTQLMNRREFLTQSQAILDRLRESGQPSAVILFDLDEFKRINDDAGHPAGDYVLQRVGQLCRSVLRPCDLLARIGGDEFAVLLPAIDVAHAVGLAESMNRVVRSTPATLGPLAQLQPTITLGIATCARSLVEISAMMAGADGAMLEAKRAGRNRIHVVRL